MAITLQTTYSAAPAIGYEGQLEAGTDPSGIITMKNAEASASMRLGSGVVFKTSSPSSDKDAILPTAETNKACGIVIRSHAYQPAWTDLDGVVHGSLDANGVRAGHMVNILRRGRILVRAEDAVVPGDRLWIRCTVGSPTDVEYVGSLTNADEGTETIDATAQGQWLTTAAAGALAWLEVDFTNI